MIDVVQCPNGHQETRYLALRARLWTTCSRWCAVCGHPMVGQQGWPSALTYFSEKSARYIDNLGVTVRSHGQHVAVMKEKGVEPATEWHTSKRLSDGVVPQAPKIHERRRILA